MSFQTYLHVHSINRYKRDKQTPHLVDCCATSASEKERIFSSIGCSDVHQVIYSLVPLG